MNRVGIVGGVGPFAALHFYQRLLQLSGASADPDYPAVVLVADQMPSRIDHLVGRGPSPLPVLLDTVRALERAGVDLIVIPSATTHAYRDALAAAVSVPIDDMVAGTAQALRERGYRRPLVLATQATVALRTFEPVLAPGSRALYPDQADQTTLDGVIDAVKAGTASARLRQEFTDWLRPLPERVAGRPDCVLLGCTELSLIAPATAIGPPVVDVTDVLVETVLSAQRDEDSRVEAAP